MAKGLLIAGRHVEVPDQLKDGEHQFLQLDDKGNLKVLLHGRDGAVPVPVKVDDQGRLVLAGQISLDPGDINIGGVVVKDSNDDELFTDDNPGKVTLTGHVPTYQGLSTDAKPSLDSADRAWFYEQDTGNLYYWDGSEWVVSD